MKRILFLVCAALGVNVIAQERPAPPLTVIRAGTLIDEVHQPLSALSVIVQDVRGYP